MKDRVTPKQFALDLLAGVPDSAGIDDLRETFDVILALLESYRDEEEGRLIPHSQVEAEMDEWSLKSTGRPEPSAT